MAPWDWKDSVLAEYSQVRLSKQQFQNHTEPSQSGRASKYSNALFSIELLEVGTRTEMEKAGGAGPQDILIVSQLSNVFS